MYVDVPRRLVFFDQSDTVIEHPFLTRYDPDTGTLHRVPGSQPDDVVADISRDGRRLALSSHNWVVVRGASRSRLTFVEDTAAVHETCQFLSFWSRFDPSGRYALVSTFNGKKRPVVIDLHSGECSDPIARDLDGRYAAVDPIDGRLWAPCERAKNTVLVVDCATGAIDKVVIALGAKVHQLRFSRDGAWLLVTADNDTLVCCDRTGLIRWSRNIGDYGAVGGADILFNESGSHLCLPISSTQRSVWGEDLIIDTASGSVENTVVRQTAPPARLATDWFGDHLLTHAGEVVDFFTGAVVSTLELDTKALGIMQNL